MHAFQLDQTKHFTQGFTYNQNNFFVDKNLTHIERATVQIIASFQNYPINKRHKSYSKLAEMIGCSERHAKTIIKSLLVKKRIDCVFKSSHKDGLGNIYAINQSYRPNLREGRPKVIKNVSLWSKGGGEQQITTPSSAPNVKTNVYAGKNRGVVNSSSHIKQNNKTDLFKIKQENNLVCFKSGFGKKKKRPDNWMSQLKDFDLCGFDIKYYTIWDLINEKNCNRKALQSALRNFRWQVDHYPNKNYGHSKEAYFIKSFMKNNCYELPDYMQREKAKEKNIQTINDSIQQNYDSQNYIDNAPSEKKIEINNQIDQFLGSFSSSGKKDLSPIKTEPIFTASTPIKEEPLFTTPTPIKPEPLFAESMGNMPLEDENLFTPKPKQTSESFTSLSDFFAGLRKKLDDVEDKSESIIITRKNT